MTTTLDDAPENTKFQKRGIFSLVIAHIANDSYFGFLPPILPLLVVEMDLSLSMAGLLASMFAFSGAIGQPLFGYFADRVRKGWLVALGPIGGAFVTLLVYMPNYSSMLLLIFLAGGGSACFHPVASVIAAQISGKRKGLGVSVYVAGGRLGVGIGAAISTFLVTTWGLDAIPIGGLLGLVIGIPFFFIAPKIEKRSSPLAMNFQETLSSLSDVVRPLLIMWLVNLCRTTVTMLVSTYMPLYVVSAGDRWGQAGGPLPCFFSRRRLEGFTEATFPIDWVGDWS